MKINTDFCFTFCSNKGINCGYFKKLKKAMEGIDGFDITIFPLPNDMIVAKEFPISRGYTRNYVCLSCGAVKNWTTEKIREYLMSTSFVIFIN